MLYFLLMTAFFLYVAINIGVIESSDLLVLYSKHNFECNYSELYTVYNKISEPILSFLNLYFLPCLNYSEYYTLIFITLLALITTLINIKYFYEYRPVSLIIFILFAEIPFQPHLARQFISTFIIIIIFSIKRINIMTVLLFIISFGIHNGATILAIFYCLLFSEISFTKRQFYFILVLSIIFLGIYHGSFNMVLEYYNFLNQPMDKEFEMSYISGIVKYFWFGLLVSAVYILIFKKKTQLLQLSVLSLIAYYSMNFMRINPESAFRLLLPLRYVFLPLFFSDLICKIYLNANNYYNKSQQY